MRWTRPFKTTFAAGSIVTALVISGPPYAVSDPYTPTKIGYDISYPQCVGSVAPGGAFGILGVNGGKPFTYNSCLSKEYRAAPQRPAPSLYINTGYADVYRKSISGNCAGQSGAVAGTSAQRKAWAVGCSEAEASIGYARRQGATRVAMWWLDVESANSWSETDLTLNQYAIQGATTRLDQTLLPVGIYSTPSMWVAITGGSFTPRGVAATWVADGDCKTPFTSSPVWLVQSVVGGVDRNYAC